jgi:hypothetical protein
VNTSVKTLLLGAAGAGLMSGASGAPSPSYPLQNGSGPAASRLGALTPGFAAEDPAPKHSCKGKNSCKGQGGCKTSLDGCKGKNSCKGRGGCATNGGM